MICDCCGLPGIFKTHLDVQTGEQTQICLTCEERGRVYVMPRTSDGHCVGIKHVWLNQFGDDWVPDAGALCQCGKNKW